MAGPAAAVAEAWGKVTVFVYSQLYDERKRAHNNAWGKVTVFVYSQLYDERKRAHNNAWGKVTVFVYSQLYDERKRAHNNKIAKALGLFAGSILFMRTCGDIMAI